ncbi:MAG: DEAD/DEAH box helicase [Candidatus Hydrogenedentota bacterium]
MSFNDYDLDPFILKYLKRQGIEEPTPIQAKAIPLALQGKDLLAISQTGSGKTLAFALPGLACLDEDPPGRNRMLVLTPTRELCQQVHKVVEALGRILELNSVCIFGGVSIDRQTKALRRGVDIIIATPGRLIDHMERGNIDFRDLSTLVLDEGDRMLDMGFMPDIKRILKALPENRQTMLFSATFPKEIEKLTKQFLYQPERIEIGSVSPAKAVRQEVYTVDQAKKPRLLEKLLGEPNVTSTIVFMRTKHRTDRVTKTMQKLGFKAAAIHGGRSQSQRKLALDGFRKGKYEVLLATDVAARGIDIQGVTHVINYDIPTAFDDYVHRIGRTARANADGDAITFVTPEDKKLLADIERDLGHPIPRAEWVGSVDVATDSKPERKKSASQRNGAPKQSDRSERSGRPSKRRRNNDERPQRSRKSSERSENSERSEGRPAKKRANRPSKKRNNNTSGAGKSSGNNSHNSSRPAKPDKRKQQSRGRNGSTSGRPSRQRANA